MQPTLPRDFAGQFVLGTGPVSLPGQVREDRIGDLCLVRASDIRLVRVRDGAGTEIGALLGTPIDYRKGSIPAEGLDLPATLGDDPDGFVEDHVFALGGSFIFILSTPDHRRVYLDACGSMSAVYEPETGRVAATAPALLDAQSVQSRFRGALYERLGVRREGWFPAGLTAHTGITRLMPNFYLDLDTFSTTRHWPLAPVAEAADPGAMCAAIMDSSRAILDLVYRESPVFTALTAGNETRMMLAASRDRLEDTTFVTVEVKDPPLDRDRARELVARFGLRHRMLPIVLADEAGANDWHARNGQCMGGPNMTSFPTVQALGRDIWFVGGLGGEIGRGFFWRSTDTAETEITAEGICARFGMPSAPEVTEAVAAWLPSVAGFDAFQTLDLAYLELRMGCWGFATSYCNPGRITIHPLISRESFTAMLALPPDWRRMEGKSNKMILTAIRHAWPDVLDLPISTYGDYRDQMYLLRKGIKRPYLIAKKLRKMFG